MNGVAYSTKTGYWRAWIRMRNLPMLVGYYATEDEAKRERDIAALHFGQTEQLFYPEDRELNAELAKGRRYSLTGSAYRNVRYDWVNECYWAKPKAWGKVQRKIGPFPPTAAGERDAALAADRYAYRFGATSATLNFPAEFIGKGRRTGRNLNEPANADSEPRIDADIVPEAGKPALPVKGESSTSIFASTVHILRKIAGKSVA